MVLEILPSYDPEDTKQMDINLYHKEIRLLEFHLIPLCQVVYQQPLLHLGFSHTLFSPTFGRVDYHIMQAYQRFQSFLYRKVSN
jgi:hypothetical protein